MHKSIPSHGVDIDFLCVCVCVGLVSLSQASDTAPPRHHAPKYTVDDEAAPGRAACEAHDHAERPQTHRKAPSSPPVALHLAEDQPPPWTKDPLKLEKNGAGEPQVVRPPCVSELFVSRNFYRARTRHKNMYKNMKAFAEGPDNVYACLEACVRDGEVEQGFWIKFDPSEARNRRKLLALPWDGPVSSIDLHSPTMFSNDVTVWHVTAVRRPPSYAV